MNMTLREYAKYSGTAPSVLPKNRTEAGLRNQCLLCSETIPDSAIFHYCDLETFE